MKRVNNPGTRLLALLLAVILVAGMLPAQVIAEGTTDVLSTEVEATVTAAAGEDGKYTLSVAMEPTTVTVDSANWTYTKPVASDAPEGTEPEDVTIPGNGTYTYDPSAGTIKSVEILTADGRYITVDLTNVTTEPASGVWTAEIEPKTETIYAGVRFAVPTEEDVKADPVKDLTWTVEIAGTYNTEEDGSYSGKAKDDEVTFVYKLQNQDQTETETETVCTLQKTFTVGETPAPTYTLSPALIAGDNYFAVDQTVTITAELKYDYVTAPTMAALPAAFGEDWIAKEGSASTWIAEASFTAGENEEKEYSFSFDGGEYKIVIDKAAPTVSDVTTYQAEGNWYTLFHYTVGISGLKEVQLNGTPVEPTTNESGIITLSHGQNKPEKVEIAVVNNAGVSSEAANNAEVGGFTVAYNYEAPQHYSDGKIYDPTGEIEITVTPPVGVTFDKTATVVSGKKADGTDLSAEWVQAEPSNAWSCKISTAEGVSDLSVTPVGKLSNGVIYTGEKNVFGPEIARDTTAPVIGKLMVGTEELTSKYYGEETTVTLTVQDVLLNTDKSYLEYTLEGENSGTKVYFTQSDSAYVASFTLTNEQTLTGVRVLAEDIAGNPAAEKTFENLKVKVDTEAPVVSFTASENVTGFYQAADGKYYAILENPVHSNKDAEAEEVSVTATITDWAIDPGEGWTQDSENPREWIKVFTVTVDKNAVKTLDVNVTAVDMAGHKGQDTTLVLAVQKAGQVTTSVPMTAVDGVYTQNIQVDRRTPENVNNSQEAPLVTLKDANGNTNIEEILYSSAPTFTFAVEDGGAGLNSAVLVALKDGLEGVFLTTAKEVTMIDGVGTIEIAANGDNETDSATLSVEISDEVGNTYHYSTNLRVDTKAPVITIEKTVENGTKVNTVDGVDYYNGEVTYTVTAADLNLEEPVFTYTVNGVTKTLDIGGKFTVGDGDKLTAISLKAKDKAGNITQSVGDASFIYNSETEANEYNGNPLVVDTTNPVVTVTKTLEKDATLTIVDGVEYYNGEVTYQIRVEDANLKEIAEDSLPAYLTVVSSGDVKMAWDADQNAYIGSFTLTDGDEMENFSIKALDFAQNPAAGVTVGEGDTEFAYNEESEAYVYARKVVVDMTPAKVTLTKSQEAYVQRFNGVDYYNGAITYTLDIEDTFITREGSKVALAVVYQDGTKLERTLSSKTGDTFDFTEVEAGHYQTVFTVINGQALDSISISVKDNAGNVTQEKNFYIEDEELDAEGKVITAFAFADGKFTSTNPRAVVDTTRPTVRIDVNGNVKSFYTYGGVVYVELNAPATGSSGENAKENEETVTLKVIASDKNLTLKDGSVYKVLSNLQEDTGAWNGDEKVNENMTLVYTKSITVAPDATGVFSFDLTVADMAGNCVEAGGISYETVNGIAPVVSKLPGSTSDNGTFGSTISVDRRRPHTTETDNHAPVIAIEPSVTDFTTSNNGLDLFNKAFNFALTVTDGEKSENNSGLHTVDWKIEDENQVVKAAGKKNVQADGTYIATFEIPVTLAEGVASGETNAVKLTIIAVDKVGNTVTYIKEFAFDNLAPRVLVTYDNNSAQNGKYFKADRIATITVEDINFDETATSVTTQVPVTAWSRNGDVYTATASYTEDGEYTFDMASTDKAGNVAVIDYGDSVAPTEFTLDKTAPVINVSYNPNQAVGRDGNGVSFYAQDLNVTVSINEVNFNAAEVRSDFQNRNQLSAFNTNGQIHTARATFTEGNEYSFTVEYTDLAGNPATKYQSDIFSVDKTAPTITISEGDMTTQQLNIVQGDLVLGFTVNDAQENLAGFSAKVVHLNNNFQTVEVTGDAYFTLSNENDRTTGYVNITNIAKEKENDGIYVISINAKDYANNTVALSPDLAFSLNRFGSSFITADNFTADFLTPSGDGNVYRNGVLDNLVIQEINPNRVWQDSQKTAEGSKITVTVNGNAVVLEKDTDYTVTEKKEGTGTNGWYVYTYEIYPANFLKNDEPVDGKYAILLYGEDEAGNKNTNESNAFSQVQQDGEGVYSGKISFTLDHKPPIITVLGIAKGDSLDMEFKRVEINVSDNTPTGISVSLNGNAVPMSETIDGHGDNTVWLAWDEATGNYILNIPEKNFTQTLQISATDASGNTSEHMVDDFLITSNWFIRAINNPWIVGGTIFGVLAAGIVIFLLARKKKKVVA